MRIRATAVIAAVAIVSCGRAHAVVTPNPLFSDGAVLQRGRPIRVFGAAAAGETVTVTLNGAAAVATAAGGRWRVELPAMRAGGPYTLSIAGASNTVVCHDVLIGEVWLAGGQSNMGFLLRDAQGGPAAAAAATDPLLRLCHVPNNPQPLPIEAAPITWNAASPQSAAGFSAVAYYFARSLRRAIHVPVGIIESDWGGTAAETWVSAEALSAMPEFAPAITKLAASAKDPDRVSHGTEAWYAGFDPGSVGKTWADPQFDDSSWPIINMPSTFGASGITELKDSLGIVWLRRSFELPASWVGKEPVIHLGPIDDADTVYINGVRVGGLDRADLQRDYRVPASLLHAGRNLVAIRVLNVYADGGMLAPVEKLSLEVPYTENRISLAGAWRYKFGVHRQVYGLVNGIDPYTTPNALYNGMIAPIAGYPLRGAIWYQGESNAYDAVQYRTLLPIMIRDWRARWGQGDFPFYMVQLAPFMARTPEPGESNWALLREAQRQIALTEPNTGLAVITDVGDEKDIHPVRKEPVGERLALLALQSVYKQRVLGQPPMPGAVRIEGSRMSIRFKNTGGGLKSGVPGPLPGFEIAGADRKYVNADAELSGDTVTVSSPRVPQPAAVRYGWANYPAGSLTSGAGLPASPFQTDPFPARK